MGYEYGRKVHAVIDTDSLSVMEWKMENKNGNIFKIPQFSGNHV